MKKKTFEFRRTKKEIRSKILYNFNMLLSQKEMGRKKNSDKICKAMLYKKKRNKKTP